MKQRNRPTRVAAVNQPNPRSGLATVELAVTVPFFLLILMGIVEISRALDVTQRLIGAVREGGRSAAAGEIKPVANETRSQTILREMRSMLAAGGINPNHLTLTLTHADGGREGAAFNLDDNKNNAAYFRVTASVPFDKVSLFTGKFLKGKDLKAATVFRKGTSTMNQ